jgi:predicted metal-dependent hydrolase
VENKPYNPELPKPRRVRFVFPETLPRLWLRGSRLQTHFWNGLNLFVPAFERYMVRVMHAQLPQVKDATLREQIRGFMGQEATHSRMHEAYNALLQRQGYRLEGYLAWVEGFFSRGLERALSPRLNLALLAGFEHFTALLSEMMISEGLMEGAAEEMKQLWEWHAAEELEHKAVAFDYLKGVGGGYVERGVGALLGVVVVVGLTLAGMVLLGTQERGQTGWGWLREVRACVSGFTRRVPRALVSFLEYLKPGFHPCQHDTDACARRVLAA